MHLESFKNIYFLGIGGIGMSGLATWFQKAGYYVAGYDRTPTPITKQLQALNIEVSFKDELESIPKQILNNASETLVVYTPAIPHGHVGFNYLQKNDYTIIKRAKALGLLVSSKYAIAVAGTHGKTSVSTTVASIFNLSEKGCNAFLGGVSKNFNSNVLINPACDKVVVEADEFDRSFLTLFPDIAIVTSMDADHLDIYDNVDDLKNTFEMFIGQIKQGGTAIVKQGLIFNKSCNKHIAYKSYALDHEADYFAQDIKVDNGYYQFNIVHPKGILYDVKLGVPGLYNVENAIAACAAALICGVSEADIKQALVHYQGVKRRFDVLMRDEKMVFIDDYAHHPEEIKACLKSLRHLYPDKKITAVFQPHLFTRTRDFAQEFAHSLDGFDQVIITDIYPAREEPIEGITSQSISELMTLEAKSLCAYNNVVTTISTIETDVLVTMGAGDIDKLVEPIHNVLQQKIR